jgi:peptidyl-prolyl cis-trans isomerase D
MASDTLHERMKGWFARILLALIIVSFALFGIDAYFKGGSSAQWVAEVGKQKISAVEWDTQVKNLQARLREAGEKDPAKLESKEVKQEVLDRMIRERLLVEAADDQGYALDQTTLMQIIANNPDFQENGKFSEQRFDAILRYSHVSRAQYFESVREEALINAMMGVVLGTGFVPHTAVDRVALLMGEQREVSKAVVSANALLGSVHVDDSEVQNYYRSHPEVSRAAEQAKVEYIVFSPETLLPQVQVSDSDVQKYYEQHISDFSTPEQRELSSILIRVSPEAKEAERKAAEQKAQKVLKLAQEEPGKFAELARQYSEDPSTAPKGGSMGFIARGSIFPQVEKAAFQMKVGEVSGLVQSPAGYNILFLKSVKPGVQRPLNEIKAQVSEAAKRQAAMSLFNSDADSKFSDLVYAQFSSLKPAADAYKLTVQTSDWFGRSGPAQGILKNDRLLQAIFSDDAIKQKRNTEAIEVAPNTMVAARIVDYKPAGQKPLADVRADIERILAKKHAQEAALKEGESDLAALRQGGTPTGLKFSAPSTVDRQNARGFAPAEVEAIFRADAKKLPAYTGVALESGDYAIYRIEKVSTPEARVAEAKQVAPVLLQRALANLTSIAYVDSLKQNADIKIREQVLEKAEQP